MEPWMTSPETSPEFRHQHGIWDREVYSKNQRVAAINKMVEIAVTWEELLELLRIVSEDKQREIVFGRMEKLAGNNFEMWFNAFRMALVSERKKEQGISFERMRKVKGSFAQWREVRQFTYIYDETRDERAAFQEMKNLANNLTEKCKVWKIMLGISKV